MNRRKVQQLLGVLALLAVIAFGAQSFSAQQRDSSGDLRLWFFDVGQGDGMLIDTPQHQQVLIDGGPSEVILQKLAQALPLSDKDLDLVIVTHNHSDHLTGVSAVLQHYSVKQIWVTGAIHTTDTYRTFLKTVSDRHVPIEAVHAGKTVKMNELEGIVIHPLDDLTGQLPDDQNAASLVTYWQYGKTSWLMTGDLTADREQALLERGVVKPVTILKVGHQGSKTSSSEAFLRALKPAVAVITAGKGNQFGHPHQVILDRLRLIVVKIYRTDQNGTIRFSIWPDGYQVSTGL